MGNITYLNTSGFGIRKKTLLDCGGFNLSLPRGSDTGLLYSLNKQGIKPAYLESCTVYHHPQLNLFSYLLKHFYIGYKSRHVRINCENISDIFLDIVQKRKIWCNIKNEANLCNKPHYLLLILIAYSIELLGRFVSRFTIGSQKRFSLLSAVVDDVSEEEIISKILYYTYNKKQVLISYLNAWTLILTEYDKSFASIIKETCICAADGMGAVLASFLTKLRFLRKITLHDYYRKLFKELENRRSSIVLIGGYDGLSQMACEVIERDYPKLKIIMNHTGFMKSQKEENLIVNQLALSKPDIVFLSMSQPVQEKWFFKHKSKLPSAVFICTGAFFEFLTGFVKPLPDSLKFIRRIGFEWLWRLFCNPKKLWRRYLIGIPKLCFIIFKYNFKLLCPKTDK